MRAILGSLLFLVMVPVQITHAIDVDYKLSIAEVSEVAQPKVEEPFAVVVKDRMWVAPGIEECTQPVKSQRILPPSTSQRIRIEPSSQMHDSYCIDLSDYAVQAPNWIGDALWPRTKELLHYVNEPRPSPREPAEVILFLGPPVITR